MSDRAIEIGICSFSFHRRLAAGKQDMFGYIKDCKALGCTQLDPWNAHLAPLKSGDDVLTARDPTKAKLDAADDAYIQHVREAAQASGLPIGCIAVDGTNVYDLLRSDEKRQIAHRWIAIAAMLEAKQVRIDAGGPADMPEDVLREIAGGYRELMKRAGDVGIEVLFENHFGPTPFPKNCIRLLDAVPGLGLLFDTNNWAPGHQDEGFELCPGRAKACHVKISSDPTRAQSSPAKAREGIRALWNAGYRGPWGVESVAKDDSADEIELARTAIELIKSEVTSLRQGGAQ